MGGIMIGKGVFRENFQPQSCSGKRAPKTGQGNVNFENIVIIDGDSDQVDDVEIIDFDEFVRQKLHGSTVPSRDRTYTRHSVISVDDDDSDDDGIIAEGVGELDSDASSSKRFSPAPSRVQNSVDIDADDSKVYKKGFVPNAQKSREACSTKATGQNRYGFGGSENESSESDCSDCELLEARELWEKASFKRKRHAFNDQFSYDEQPSSSGFHSNIYVDVDMENMTEQHAGSPECSGPSQQKHMKENQSTSSKGDSHVNEVHSDCGIENPFGISDKKVGKESFKPVGPDSVEEVQCLRRSSDIEHEGGTRCADISHFNYNNGSSCGGVAGTSRSEEESGVKESNFMSSSLEVHEVQVDNKGSASRSEGDNFSEAKSNCISFDEGSVNCDGLVLHAKDCDPTAREKHKETDEYKRANEEELASRQQQLRIQAEEAQRLRKRKRLETMRLLNMQRRQKERVEEVRETQKKDEEFLNMKEQLRVEIRKGLNQLEMRCSDMASLLRGLGIHVGGGFIPLPNDVQAAYKRALLKFHPDRASKTDVREQVEAEEKFKLISRMKEKFLLTSCH